MAVDTLDDVIEEVLNALGIYGAHDEECAEHVHSEKTASLRSLCRSCAASYLGERIRNAAEIDRKLRA